MRQSLHHPCFSFLSVFDQPCIQEQLLYACLEDWLLKRAIDFLHWSSPFLDSLQLCSQEANEGRLLDRKAFLVLFFQEAPYQLGRLKAIANGHINIHYDQSIGRSSLVKSSLDHVECLLAIGRQVALHAVLLKQVDDCNRAEEVVIDDQHLLRRIVKVKLVALHEFWVTLLQPYRGEVSEFGRIFRNWGFHHVFREQH